MGGWDACTDNGKCIDKILGYKCECNAGYEVTSGACSPCRAAGLLIVENPKLDHSIVVAFVVFVVSIVFVVVVVVVVVVLVVVVGVFVAVLVAVSVAVLLVFLPFLVCGSSSSSSTWSLSSSF